MGNPIWGAGRHAGLIEGRQQGVKVGLALGVAVGGAAWWGFGKVKERWGRRAAADAPPDGAEQDLAETSALSATAGVVNGSAPTLDPGEGESVV